MTAQIPAKGRIRKNNETEILQAAEYVFARAGYAGARIADIAERANLPKANLHYYFQNKQTVYKAVLENILHLWLTQTDSIHAESEPRAALEQYIRAKMTDVTGATSGGHGKILANFREIVAPSRAIVEAKVAQLKEAGINGVYVLGNTSEPVCQIAVHMNRVGMVLLGGLNPIAVAAEAGIEVENIAESGLVDFQRLRSYRELFNK